ncbi:MAG: fibronectin type III domain-containing protein, partial [Candidatus Omnitrophica bacterium]|nr:fibronectin type III domain-containing protein [Candidatus Omnitrophota bacterium]
LNFTDPSGVNPPLQPNTTYYYKVRAFKGTDTSAYSNVANATTLPILNAPTNLQASALSASAIYMSWSDSNSNENGFEIWRSTSSTGTYVQIGSAAAGSSLNFTDPSGVNPPLQPNTTYYYKVRAFKGTDTSAYSNVANATTQAAITLTAAIETNITSGRTPLNVYFSGAKSTCTGGVINAYYWNFGDSTPQGSGQTIYHNFINRTGFPRVYTVTLTITTNTGKTASTSKNIMVNP